ncbi:MAG TPA: helix-turn-helix transcriptional regulator [Pseudomonadales bacterium]|nr:helix-turn-helix transcriptional regulator [Pseudomonadales bacterium]
MNKLDQTYLERSARLLRQARLDAGLSLREVARRAGTSHSTLLAYESGRKVPSIVTFLRILEACGYGVDIVVSNRVKYRDGIERGEELERVLDLAAQFPARVPRRMNYPRFPATTNG